MIQKIHSLNELPAFAQFIYEQLEAGDWLFLEGDLGAGKTALAKELSILYGVTNFFTSPTFSLLNSVNIFRAELKIKKILHLDLYRLKSVKELCFIGLEQEFNVKNSIAIFEWPDVMEKEDWDYFFTITQCPRPNRILKITITYAEQVRIYEMKFFSISSME